MNQILITTNQGNHETIPMSRIQGKGYGQGTWNDQQESFTGRGLDTSTGRIGFDTTEHMFYLASNARYPDEPIAFGSQTDHGWATGTPLKFHLHMMQTFDALPNMLLKVRHWANFEQVPSAASFDFVCCDGYFSTYVGPRYGQIITFPDTDMSRYTGLTTVHPLSINIQYILYRDSANSSGLFAGADPYSADLLMNTMDYHWFGDATGSRREYVK